MTYIVLVSLIWLWVSVGSLRAADIPETLKQLKPKDFPKKPIELILAYPAGGAMDLTARMLGKHLEKYIGTQVVVINKVGGQGLVCHIYASTSSSKDGHEVFFLADTLLTDDILRAEGKWSYKNISPIAFVNFIPAMWIVRKDSKFGGFTLKQLIDYAVRATYS